MRTPLSLSTKEKQGKKIYLSKEGAIMVIMAWHPLCTPTKGQKRRPNQKQGRDAITLYMRSK